MTMFKTVRLLSSVGAAFLTVGLMGTTPCHAQGIDAVPLSDLLTPDGEIINGDKKFDQFTYTWTGDMPGPEEVNVVTITDSDGNLGIRFQGAFVDLFSTAGGTRGGSDALISFRVQVTDPDYVIVDAHLAGNPELLSAQEVGSMSVTETLDFDTTGAYQLSIYDDETAGKRIKDSTTFGPRTSLRITKDILGIAVDSGSVTMSWLDQTFSQRLSVDVPEASSELMMLVGLGCLAGFGWRRRPLA
ncbi:MAG: hypothetical protein BMS9Abin04_242 [Planctomycetia bacterium]|nr:MAG: hypothetical protein BMS9Abin04_242 [Planctomycetia bacterium]